ncbi:hypothetical protein [uncultured Parasphingorhabdus sp.]|uniref:hypothetical protein n=1 Tax=uncultured Parasphingorhabdus sp. TaxID=2709694 RepID=UPI0030D70D83|tara:strand:+ start:40363 stop:40773 length:411 start_codon:yes stop_codon:yes gene_type:complete
MANVLKAGVLYFLGVFALGFILGAIRIFFLVPYSGPVVAVLVELPFILLVSWFFCRFLTRRFTVPAEPYERLIMGLVAFSCLMIGEALVAVFLQQGRMTDFLMTFDLPENRIGLAGQIAFALFPLLQSYADSKAGR